MEARNRTLLLVGTIMDLGGAAGTLYGIREYLAMAAGILKDAWNQVWIFGAGGFVIFAVGVGLVAVAYMRDRWLHEPEDWEL